MLSISNTEIAKLSELGDKVKCWNCDQEHPIEYGETIHPDGTRTPSKSLAFFKCGDSTYLCGINGKEWRPNVKKHE